jgi:hypothetical protein
MRFGTLKGRVLATPIQHFKGGVNQGSTHVPAIIVAKDTSPSIGTNTYYFSASNAGGSVVGVSDNNALRVTILKR